MPILLKVRELQKYYLFPPRFCGFVTLCLITHQSTEFAVIFFVCPIVDVFIRVAWRSSFESRELL